MTISLQYMGGSFIRVFPPTLQSIQSELKATYLTFFTINASNKQMRATSHYLYYNLKKHKCECILSRYYINVLSFQIQNIFKMCAGEIPVVLRFFIFFVGLLTMLLHHIPLAKQIHELLFMSSCTICPCFWISASLSQLESSIRCPFHFIKYSKYFFLKVLLLTL
jgi:hypothetical protein